ncbi:MAG: hypothetical protein ABFC18_06380 [Rikenellaceae bacterium]
MRDRYGCGMHFGIKTGMQDISSNINIVKSPASPVHAYCYSLSFKVLYPYWTGELRALIKISPNSGTETLVSRLKSSVGVYQSVLTARWRLLFLDCLYGYLSENCRNTVISQF